MTEKDEDLIKKRAYALWESEGRPEGKHDEHWTQAYRELSDADNTAVLGEPEGDGSPAAEPVKAVKTKAPVSAGEGNTAANPAAKRKRKTV